MKMTNNSEIEEKEQIKDSYEEIEETINNKFWNVYSDNTSKLSKICRQLAFAEGGICWFYINNKHFSIQIKLTLTLLLLFFIADAFQYFLLAINNKKYAELYEDLLSREIIKKKEQIHRPASINISGTFCYGLKIFFIIIASLLLIANFYY